MADRDDLSAVLREGEFLVGNDYRMGGLWGVLMAPSEEAIRAKCPKSSSPRLDRVDGRGRR